MRSALPRRLALALAVMLLSGVAMSGCGGEEPPAYSRAVAQQLQVDVDAVREAAEDHRAHDTQEQLATLTRHVADAQAAGDLPGRRARAILRAADLVAADAEAFPTPTPTPKPKPTKKSPKKHKKPARKAPRHHHADGTKHGGHGGHGHGGGHDKKHHH